VACKLQLLKPLCLMLLIILVSSEVGQNRVIGSPRIMIDADQVLDIGYSAAQQDCVGNLICEPPTDQNGCGRSPLAHPADIVILDDPMKSNFSPGILIGLGAYAKARHAPHQIPNLVFHLLRNWRSYGGRVNSSFTNACNGHDTCYGTFGTDQGNCDRQLRSSLRRQCDGFRGNSSDPRGRFLLQCQRLAQLYYEVLSWEGEAGYESGQRNGRERCHCEQPASPSPTPASLFPGQVQLACDVAGNSFTVTTSVPVPEMSSASFLFTSVSYSGPQFEPLSLWLIVIFGGETLGKQGTPIPGTGWCKTRGACSTTYMLTEVSEGAHLITNGAPIGQTVVCEY
jgi:hypothetical protein